MRMPVSLRQARGASRLAGAHNIAELRRLAQGRLPRMLFDHMDGAAEDEVTLARNADAFQRYDLVPRVLVDVSAVDLSTTLLGQAIDVGGGGVCVAVAAKVRAIVLAGNPEDVR